MKLKNNNKQQLSLNSLLILMGISIAILSVYFLIGMIHLYNKDITDETTTQEIAERQLFFSSINGFLSAIVVGLFFAFITIYFTMREYDSNTDTLLVNIRILFDELKFASNNKDISKMKHVAERLFQLLSVLPRTTKWSEESITLCINVMYEKIDLNDKRPMGTINNLISRLDDRRKKHHKYIKERLGKDENPE